MNRAFLFVFLSLVLLLGACDQDPAPETSSAEAPPSEAASPETSPAGDAAMAEPADAEKLPTPFTAEQIRDEWVQGLTLLMHTQTPNGETWDRWTVVAADDEGAEIEFQSVDSEGRPTAEARTSRSAWTELRDHASFAADVATREEAKRSTALGEIEGWLYRVRDEAAGTTTEFFFGTELPGAPLQMRVAAGDQVMMEMTQIEREKPSP